MAASMRFAPAICRSLNYFSRNSLRTFAGCKKSFHINSKNGTYFTIFAYFICQEMYTDETSCNCVICKHVFIYDYDIFSPIYM